MLILINSQIILAFILANILFFLIKRIVLKEEFRVRYIFFHSDCISKFKEMSLSETNKRKRDMYIRILFWFKLSLGYLVFLIFTFILYKL